MLYQLDKLDVGEIDFAVLRAAKLVPANAKQAKIVKKGDLTKKFVLKGVLATAGAKAAIEAAGGSRGVSDLGASRIQRHRWSAGSVNSPSSASACCSSSAGADRLPHRQLSFPVPGVNPQAMLAADGKPEGHHRGHVQHVLRRRAAALQPVRAERRCRTSRRRSSCSWRARSTPRGRRCRRKARAAAAR